MSKYAFTLVTRPNGSYHANSLIALAWHVFWHRVSHLLAGDGWRD